MAKDNPKKIIQEVGKEALNIQESIDSISGKLTSNLKELNRVTGDTQKMFNNTLSTSSSLGKKLAEINENSLKSAKERKSLEEQLIKNTKEITSLERQRDQFMRKAQSARGAEQKSLLKIAELLGDAVTYSKEQVANAEKLSKVYVDIEKNLGLTGKILEGINQIPILNKFVDTKKALEAANEEAAKLTGNRWNVLGAALKSLGSSLKKNLTDPLILLSATGGAVAGLVELFNEFDKRAVSIGRNFGTTPENARKTAEEMAHIAAHSGNILSTTGNITEAFNDLNAVAGTYANFSQETLEAYNDLVKGLGLSKEATIAQYKVSVLQGKNLKDFSTQIAGQVALQKSQNKIALSDKEIMESIAKTTAVQRLNIKGGAEGLVKSVIEAKKLGAEFSSLENAANSLLNFEDSISAELEAELLTGQNLNLERARAYALNNDIAGLAKEINNQGINAEKFSKMNRIQQEAIAKSLGFQRDEFGQMLENQEMLNAANRAGAKDVNDLAAQYAKAANKEEFLKKIGDDKLKSQVKNIAFQEKLNNLTEKLKDIFVTKLEPVFSRILDKLGKIIDSGAFEKVSHSIGNIVKFLTDPVVLTSLGVLGTIMAGKSIKDKVQSLFGGKRDGDKKPLLVEVVGGGGTSGGGGGIEEQLSDILDNEGDDTITYDKKSKRYRNKKGYVSNKDAVQSRYNRRFGGKGKFGKFGKLGKLGKLGKGLSGGVGGLLGGLALDYAAGSAKEAGHENLATGLDIGSSVLTGATTGAMFGGPIGAIAGGALGGIYGLLSATTEADAKKMDKAHQMAYQNNPSAMRAQRIYSNLSETNADVARYTSISGGEVSGNEKTNELLQKISSQLSEKRDIVMSGNKVGSAIAVGDYKQA